VEGVKRKGNGRGKKREDGEKGSGDCMVDMIPKRIDVVACYFRGIAYKRRLDEMIDR
jgi:hypothetical protein